MNGGFCELPALCQLLIERTAHDAEGDRIRIADLPGVVDRFAYQAKVDDGCWAFSDRNA
ncbi:hypothetical protein [Methylobacterium sp. CM6246]